MTAAFVTLAVYLGVTSFLFGFTCGMHVALRRGHAMTCRTTSTVELVLAIGQDLGAFGLSWAVGGWKLTVAYLGALGLSEVALARRRNRFTVRAVYGRWREHREHDDDCEFGPRERQHGSRVRLRSWRKVAIRPGFAPT